MVTAIEETISAIQHVIQQLQQSAGFAGSAAKSAEEGRTRASQLGARTSIAQFGQLHEGLAAVQNQIGALNEQVKRLLSLAKAIHGG